MIHMMRKVRCKYTGSDEYQPEGIDRKVTYPVIAYEIRRREKPGFEDKPAKVVEEIFFIVLNSNAVLTTVASFNCKVYIDENAEFPGGQAIQLMNNILTMGKVLSEKLAAHDNGSNPSGGEKSD